MKPQGATVDKTIRNHMMMSMGAGLIPFPLADLFTVGAIQLDLIRRICKIYDVDFKEEEGKAILTSLTSSTLAKLGARAAIKLIPGIGTIVGGVTMSLLSGASTYAVGHAFRTHFEKGGTILDIDLGRLRKVYHEKFEKGKEEAAKQEDLSGKMPPDELKEDPDYDDHLKEMVQKLKDLGELRREGIITGEEFERMKKKILNDT